MPEEIDRHSLWKDRSWWVELNMFKFGTHRTTSTAKKWDSHGDIFDMTKGFRTEIRKTPYWNPPRWKPEDFQVKMYPTLSRKENPAAGTRWGMSRWSSKRKTSSRRKSNRTHSRYRSGVEQTKKRSVPVWYWWEKYQIFQNPSLVFRSTLYRIRSTLRSLFWPQGGSDRTSDSN